MAIHPRRRRKGVVLLICLSLLVLFLLITVTFLILSTQYMTGAKAMAKHGIVGDDWQKEIEPVAYQVFVGPRPLSKSAINGHDLLRDMYGTDSIKGVIAGATVDTVTGNQFIRIQFAGTYNQRAGYYNGRVFTILNGLASGVSTRVVDYNPTTSTFLVEMLETDAADLVTALNANANFLAGSTFLVNGAAFNGTGFGFPQAGGLNLDDTVADPVTGTQLPIALLPNFPTYFPRVPNDRPDFGGADESWDAVDYQNMFLAKNMPGDIDPSFHRRALVQFWTNYYNTLGTPPNADQIRRFVLRPLWTDHPNFTGSNSDPRMSSGAPGGIPDLLLALASGAYDVDNDGDGIPDSIWLDLDLPLKTAPDGRRYKPLVALLIQDLDGRLNLNAHSSFAHTSPTYSEQPVGAWAGGGGPPMGRTLARGVGFGPADIAFGHLTGSAAEFTALLNGRYGADGAPSISGVNDPLSAVKTLGIPPDYTAAYSAYATPPDVWGRSAIAVDYAGQPLYPYMNAPPSQTDDDPYELDLSANGSQDTGAWDAPYTLAECERLLRFYDVDSNLLPNRLLLLAPNTFAFSATAPVARRSFATHSMHVPVVNFTAPPLDRATLGGAGNGHYTDLFASRLAAGMSVPATDPTVAQQLAIMFPPEMYRGQLFNVNRLFGNGRDDNGNFVVDEPAERDAGETLWASPPAPGQFNGVAFNYLNNDPHITINRFAPQIYARNLYCMLMFLADQGYYPAGGNPVTPIEAGALTVAQRQELTARRLAQWAINVVDFRDSDSIMSPFEYDVNPFNGWQPMDGDPTSDELIGGSNPDRRIVWGCEYPDLLITETKAFHNRRVKDTNFDTSNKSVGAGVDDDKDVDQFAIPQGSLFLELYCPRNYASSNPALPRELYRPDGKLDLARLAPAGLDGLSHPVWQIVISQMHNGGANVANSPLQRATTAPDSTSFDPPNMSLLVPPPAPLPVLPIERVVWFTSQNPAGTALAANTFWNSLGWDVAVAPGQYAVVGPRATTIFGSLDNGDPADVYDGPSLQSITLLAAPNAANTRVVVSDTAGNGVGVDPPGVRNPVVGSQIQSAVGIVADTNPPAGWMNANRRIGLNVTEPLPQSATYYGEPNPTNDARVPADAYDDPVLPMSMLPDEPLDSQAGHPLFDNTMVATKTYTNVRSAFLQRLANPLEPWHSQANPYITIDWAAIDATVFAGDDNTDRQSRGADLDPNDPPGARTVTARTRERGLLFGGAPTGNIWSPITVDPAPPTAAAGSGTNYFDYNIVSTLSYLNSTAAPSRLSSPPALPGYAGAPGNPFPWLNWLNRPFATPLELLQVPASSPSRMVYEYLPDTEANPYDVTQPPPNDAFAFHAPFAHLLNFFRGNRATTGGSGTPPQPAANFYRLLDLVETPSPYVGAERWYNPQQFAGAAPGSAADGLRPPFNRLSRFREPGRINLNTIFDVKVFEGLMKGYFVQDPSIDSGIFWDKFQRSRQGFEGQAANLFPSEYANPFRSANSADLAPNVAALGANYPNLRRDGVDATLLRADPDLPGQPLFAYKPADPLTEVAYANSRRDTHTRYHPLQRLGNLVSSHSNVYAVWITVGYFEVEPNPGGADAVHPDGYRLGAEIGSDSGIVKRHRAFYVFDRSIPVAFEPGENHNVDRAVLLKRFIE